jgi:rRNA maturation RNase YbeY
VSAPYSESLSIEQDHPSRQLDEEVLRRAIHHVLDAEDATLVHVSLVLSDHETVRRLNRSYLDHDYNTDVLSFSLRDGPGPSAPPDDTAVEGEIYVDLDTAAERHDEFDTSFDREAYRYVIHGLLHLLGYDDADSSGQKTMRKKENQYLDAVLLNASS